MIARANQIKGYSIVSCWGLFMSECDRTLRKNNAIAFLLNIHPTSRVVSPRAQQNGKLVALR